MRRKLLVLAILFIMVSHPQVFSQLAAPSLGEASDAIVVTSVEIDEEGRLKASIKANQRINALKVSSDALVFEDGAHEITLGLENGETTTVVLRLSSIPDVFEDVTISFESDSPEIDEILEYRILNEDGFISLEESIFEISREAGMCTEALAYSIRDDDAETSCRWYRISFPSFINPIEGTDYVYVFLTFVRERPYEVLSAFVSFDINQNHPVQDLGYAYRAIFSALLLDEVTTNSFDSELDRLVGSVDSWYDATHGLNGFFTAFLNGFLMGSSQALKMVLGAFTKDPSTSTVSAYTGLGSNVLEITEAARLGERISNSIMDYHFLDQYYELTWDTDLLDIGLQFSRNGLLLIDYCYQIINLFINVKDLLTNEGRYYLLSSKMMDRLFNEFNRRIMESVTNWYLSIPITNTAKDVGGDLQIEYEYLFTRRAWPIPESKVLNFADTYCQFSMLIHFLAASAYSYSKLFENENPDRVEAWWGFLEETFKLTSLPYTVAERSGELVESMKANQGASTEILNGIDYAVYGYKTTEEGDIRDFSVEMGIPYLYIERDDMYFPERAPAVGLATIRDAIGLDFYSNFISVGGPARNSLSYYINTLSYLFVGARFYYSPSTDTWEIRSLGSGSTPLLYYRPDGQLDYGMIVSFHQRKSNLIMIAAISAEGTSALMDYYLKNRETYEESTKDITDIFEIDSGNTVTQRNHYEVEAMQGVVQSRSVPVLMEDSVSPLSGTYQTEFTFEVTYLHFQDKGPSNVYLYLDSSKHVMKQLDTTDEDFDLGVEFGYSITGMDSGDHTFFFETSDTSGKTTSTEPRQFRVGRRFVADDPERLYCHIDSPSDNAVVNGTIELMMSYGDRYIHHPVLSYKVDDEDWMEAQETERIDTTRFEDGLHTIYAKAECNRDVVMTDSVEVTVENPDFDAPKIAFVNGVSMYSIDGDIQLRFDLINIGTTGWISYSAEADGSIAGPVGRSMYYKEVQKGVGLALRTTTRDKPILVEIIDESSDDPYTTWSSHITIPSDPDWAISINYDKEHYNVGDPIQITAIVTSNNVRPAQIQIQSNSHFPSITAGYDVTIGQGPLIYQFNYTALLPRPLTVMATINPLLGDSNTTNNVDIARAFVHANGKSVLGVETYTQYPDGSAKVYERAEIYMDGKSKGDTGSHGLIVFIVPPGRHTVSTTYDGVSMSRTFSIALNETLIIKFSSKITDLGLPPDIELINVGIPNATTDMITIRARITDPEGDDIVPSARIFGEHITKYSLGEPHIWQTISVQNIGADVYDFSYNTTDLPNGRYSVLLAVDEEITHTTSPEFDPTKDWQLDSANRRVLLDDIEVFHRPGFHLSGIDNLSVIRGNINFSFSIRNVDLSSSTFRYRIDDHDWANPVINTSLDALFLDWDSTEVVDGVHTLNFVLISRYGEYLNESRRLIVANNGHNLTINCPYYLELNETVTINVQDNFGIAQPEAAVEIDFSTESIQVITDEKGQATCQPTGLGPFTMTALKTGLNGCTISGIVLRDLPGNSSVRGGVVDDGYQAIPGVDLKFYHEGKSLKEISTDVHGKFSFNISFSAFIHEYITSDLHVSIEVDWESQVHRFTRLVRHSSVTYITLLLNEEPERLSFVNTTVSPNGSIDMEWTRYQKLDFERYELHYSRSDGFEISSDTLLASVSNIDNTSYSMVVDLTSLPLYFRIVVFDVHGSAAASDPLCVELPDVEPPSINLDSPMDSFYYPTTSISVRGNVHDDFGVRETKYRVDTDDWSILDEFDTFEFLLELEEGNHTFAIRAVDWNGQRVEVVRDFNIDISPPTISLLSHSNGQCVSTPQITIKGIVDDNFGIASIEYVSGDVTSSASIDGDQWYLDATLSSGENVITFSAKDLAGNIDSFSISIQYQPVPLLGFPEVILSASEDSALVGEAIEFYATANPVAGHPIMSYYFDFGDGNISDWNSESTVSHIYSIDGHFRVMVRVRDDRGFMSQDAELTIFIQPRDEEPDIPDGPDESQETDSILDVLLTDWPYTLIVIILIISILIFLTRRR
jgi:hypothetical protein